MPFTLLRGPPSANEIGRRCECSFLQPVSSNTCPPSCLVMSEGAATGAHLTTLACNESLLVQSGSLVILLWVPDAVKEWEMIPGDKVLYVNEETAQMTQKYSPYVLEVSQGQILHVHAGCVLSIIAKETTSKSVLSAEILFTYFTPLSRILPASRHAPHSILNFVSFLQSLSVQFSWIWTTLSTLHPSCKGPSHLWEMKTVLSENGGCSTFRICSHPHSSLDSPALSS